MTRGGGAKTRGEPERRCIATGASGPTGLLVRFVLGPDAQVVPDLAAKLPGRGVWLTAERALVDKAVAKKLFSRAFKAQAAAPADLADRLETLLAQRLIDVLGLARKAGQAVTGFEKVRARLKDGTVGALVQASDGAADGKAKLARLADGLADGQAGEGPDKGPGAVQAIDVLDSTELGLAFGRDFAIHAALDRGGFADRAIGEAARLGGLRPARPIGARPIGAGTIGAGTIGAGQTTDTTRRVAGRTSDEKQAGPATVPGQGDR